MVGIVGGKYSGELMQYFSMYALIIKGTNNKTFYKSELKIKLAYMVAIT